jgi:hypothetical protein
MDEGKILLVDISKGRIGEDASRLLGAMIITKVQLAAMSRVDIPRQDRKDFTLVVDEFQNFATGSFASILSEARKFNLSLIIAHQYVKQLDETVADAVFGNVGTMIAFRVGAEDAELLEKEFAPEFLATDIVNLGFRDMYLKLMIDGVTSHAFSATTMDTIPKPERSYRDEVVSYSRSRYSHPRAEVEKSISAWRTPIEEARPEPQAPRSQGQYQGQGQGQRPRYDNRPPRSQGQGQYPRPPQRDNRPPRTQHLQPVAPRTPTVAPLDQLRSHTPPVKSHEPTVDLSTADDDALRRLIDSAFTETKE